MTDPALKAAEEALKPFANEAARYEPDEGDGVNIAWDSRFTIGNLRAAAAALALLLATTSAHAATDEICRPYASALLNSSMAFFWERAFNHCKLLEEDRPVPPTDWRAAVHIIDPDRPDVSTIGVVPATDSAVGESGFAPHTSGWNSWCKTNWPSSFRESDGTVIFEISNRGGRHLCPG